MLDTYAQWTFLHWSTQSHQGSKASCTPTCGPREWTGSLPSHWCSTVPLLKGAHTRGQWDVRGAVKHCPLWADFLLVINLYKFVRAKGLGLSGPCCSTELSWWWKHLYLCCPIWQPWATCGYWTLGSVANVTEELNFEFFKILIILNVSGHMY